MKVGEPVGVDPAEVAGAIDAGFPIGDPRIGDEGGAGALLIAPVAGADADARDADLPLLAGGSGPQILVEDKQLLALASPSDRQRFSIFVRHRGHSVKAAGNRGLGRPIEVGELDVRQPFHPVPQHRYGQRLPAPEHPPQVGKVTLLDHVEAGHEAQRRRHRAPLREALLADQAGQGPRVEAEPGRHQVQLGAGGERRVDIGRRLVEVQRRVAGDPILGPSPQLADAPFDGGKDAAVGDGHALRLPGRARGEDQVRGRLRVDAHARRLLVSVPSRTVEDAGRTLAGDGLGRQRPDRRQGKQRRDLVESGRRLRRREDEARLRRGKDPGQPRSRAAEVQRHIHRPRLHHRVHGDDCQRLLLRQQGDPVTTPDPGRDQSCCERVAEAHQLGIRQPLGLHRDRHRVATSLGGRPRQILQQPTLDLDALPLFAGRIAENRR